ncbi:PH domain-containing protein [Nocardiopsis sp. EMB25]|nr:PH domain-containing protein [Nocardiopsis lucentensis]MCY9787364.1 PH domain-containing protein [Nocardiopsis sp. EMB25]
MDTSDPAPTPNPPGPSRPDRPLAAAFAPPEGTSWTRVSPALALYRRLVVGALCLVGGVVAATLAYVWAGPGWAAAAGGAALAVLAVGWFLAGRFQRSWGYVEATGELYLTYGVFLRQLVVVPYGRMQVVDVTADLLEQALGIATVRLRTAASTADTRVVGLPLADAVELRARLAARGESFSTGL